MSNSSPRFDGPLEGGPPLAFAAPPVLAAEELLASRASAFRLSLEGLLHDDLKGWQGRADRHEALLRFLEGELPPLYAAYDAYVAVLLRESRLQVACGAGCAHCCRHYVDSVESFELLFIHARLRSRDDFGNLLLALHKRESLFRGLLGEEGAETEEGHDRALYRYYLEGRPCAFLEEGGRCGIYAMRPLSCRMFFSLSHPRYCRGRAIASPRNRNFQVELPDRIEEEIARAGRLLAGRGSRPADARSGDPRLDEIRSGETRADETRSSEAEESRAGLSEALFGGLLEVNERYGGLLPG